MSKEDQLLLKRNSFLEKELIAKNRELEIETSLETVRAKAMAMQSSADLKEVVKTLFEELRHLDVNLQACLIATFDPVTSDQRSWIIHRKTNEPYSFLIPCNEQTFYQEMLKAWKERNANWSYMLEGEAKTNWENFFFNDTDLKVLPSEVKEEMRNPKKVFFAACYYQYGAIQASSPELLSDASIDILQRFSKVFDSCYTRFLDLKKAESHAREAQIQLALERVRAKTIAMQKPSEFVDVINIIGEQFIHLGFDFDWVNFSANGLDVSKAIDIWNFVVVPGLYQGATRLIIPFFEHPVFTKAEESVNDYHTTGNSFTVVLLDKKDKDTFLDHLFTNTIYKDLPEEVKRSQYNREVYQTSNVVLKDSWLSVGKYNAMPLTDEQIGILKRLANEFGQAYTRFLDLQKAEAQAREAQIQLGLERVRAKSLAMHHSSELQEVVNIVAQQLHSMNIDMNGGVFICINKEVDKDAPLWAAAGAADYVRKVVVPEAAIPTISRLRDAIKKGNIFLEEEFSNEEKKEFFSELFKHEPWKSLAEDRKKELLSREGGYTRSVVVMQYTSIAMINHNGKRFPDEDNEILKRFGNVFEQSYVRFLDLQKAEAQAMEASIEAGLERVRSRAMGMQSSEELAALIGTVFTELIRLDLALTRCVIWIFNPETNGATWWMANSEDAQNPINCDLPYNPYEPYLVFLEQWQKRANKFQYELSGEIKKGWDDYLFSETGLSHLPAVVIEGMKAPERVFLTASFNNFGAMNAATLEPLSDQHLDVLLRFAKVFDLTYTRFNDLKQAEAQAREAQIEAALERVRAKAMAMHNSNDVSLAASMVFSELRKLGIDPIRCGVGLLNKESRNALLYSATSSGDVDSLSLVGWVMLTGHPVLENIYDTWLKKEDYYPELTGPQLKSYYENLLAGLSLPIVPNWETGEKQYGHFFSFSIGCLYTWSDRHYNDSEIKILKRFASIIDLTFRRYLDLQKAEANAKEAKIEASLERIRGKAMAMHTTQDLSDTIGSFYQELQSFSLTPIRCGVGLLEKEERLGELYTWYTTEKGQSLELVGRLKMEGHPVLNKIYESWLSQTEYHPVLRGNEIKEYYKILKPQMNFPDFGYDEVQFGYFFFFPEGGVYAWMEKEMQEDELRIYRRFTSVLSLTYKRYRDMQKAEANAKEAVKQSALDRIRADIASMRTTQDLERITPLIWNELTILGVPFIRCGVFIMDETQQLIHSFLSTSEGKAIAAFELPYDSAGELSNVLAYWRKNEIFKDHWDETKYTHWTKGLVEHAAIASEEKYSTVHVPVNLHLHFLPFLQGMLYVGSEVPLTDEEIRLAQTLAGAFSTAYARYEDFNKLEAAKKQVDKTLVELKQTQQQLVQSEKMASLGELTAGIAHEIQNPLNFVNNFSDVNSELIGEMEIELQNGNVDEAIAIANDIKENEEKINHHGKRADAIVKGMLQHSRKSSGQKEPTDINALADEYLRLSYHGLRAKDKNFNATLETDFDKSIGKINVIPQDIGRVLLNLFNNAFYACTERSRSAVNEQKSKIVISKNSGVTPFEKMLPLYEPKVCVTTKKLENSVSIAVTDNGNGIPQKVMDKIFQPFFTTKPTGQGTGLGLSLSYDIVKAHGGEIKVSSTEGEGTRFTIRLPIKIAS